VFYLDAAFISQRQTDVLALAENEFEGTGIGRPNPKSITDKHHRLITARIVANEGSVFIMVLPTPQKEQGAKM
jgi:light-regulated signal transduction histidine kinase (bacteriophytochrome)